MALSTRARKIVAALSAATKLGDLKQLGKEIRQDHDLALELWSTADHHPRLLATLLFDPKLLTESAIDRLAADLLTHAEPERNQIGDWLLANQLHKSKPLTALIETWRTSRSPVLRRWFWYHQARLRWTGKLPPPGSSADLLDCLETDMATAEPEVQWAMNFCAGQIGVFEPDLRARCIRLGKKLGLYRDQRVAKNCTPSYLPEFIRIEAAKRE